jgi:hypothetical protein
MLVPYRQVEGGDETACRNLSKEKGPERALFLLA